MGMKFSSIVDRHVGREEEEEEKKRKKNSGKIRIFSKKFFTFIDLFRGKEKKRRKNIFQIDPFAFLTRTSRGKNWLAFLHGAVETINTSRLIIG